jgi:hypothetical protein
MKKFSAFILFGITIILVFISGCGESSSTAGSGVSITSAVDADENDLSTTTEGINPTSFDITFSEAMNEASLTTDGGITFTCELPDGSSIAQPTVAIAVSEADDNTYMVTITDVDGNTPYRYQLLNCTLTVTTNVTTAEGTALSEAVEYSFSNGCAVAEDFNADSQSCWTDVASWDAEAAAWPTWDALLNTSTGLLSFETASSTLLFSTEGRLADDGAVIYKEATANEEGFSVTVKYVDLLNHGSAVETDNLIVGLIQEDPSTMEDPGKDGTWVGAMLIEDGGSLTCGIMFQGGGSRAMAFQECGGDDTFYVRMRFAGSVFHAEYSTDGSAFSTMNDMTEGTFPSDFSGYNYMLLIMETSDDPDTIFNVDFIVVEGISSTSQY